MTGSTPLEDSSRGYGFAGRPLGVPPFVIWLLVAAVLLLMSVPRLRAQDALANARSLYASAAYDEALKMLQQLSSSDGSLPPGSVREAEEYRFLCLLALGRNAEARESIGAVVTADPLYKLDENNTSPRVLTAFQNVRRELLPDIMQSIYNVGKAAYDKKDFRNAERQLRKVVELAGDPDLQGKSTDLGTLAKGFLDLAISGNAAAGAATPPPTNAAGPAATAPGGSNAGAAPTTTAANTTTGGGTPAGSAAPAGNAARGAVAAPPPAAAPAPAATTTRAGLIVPPVTLKQALPALPNDLSRFGALRSGELEVLIDETGKVQQARFTKSIHPVYDGLVMAATKNWRYDAATADGVPVKFRKTIKVTIAEPAREQE
jgi:hypothetical protein